HPATDQISVPGAHLLPVGKAAGGNSALREERNDHQPGDAFNRRHIFFFADFLLIAYGPLQLATGLIGLYLRMVDPRRTVGPPSRQLQRVVALANRDLPLEAPKILQN